MSPSPLQPATRVACAACGAQSPYATELLLQGGAGAGSSYASAAPSPSLSPKSRRASNILPSSLSSSTKPLAPSHPPAYPQAHPPHSDSMDSLAVPDAASHLPPQRRTGFAQGYADPNSRRLSSADGDAKAEVEEDEETARARQELAHQMAALQHYNQQREAYKQQWGWSCSVCSFLNDPQQAKCEMCETQRPALTAAQQHSQTQALAQQPKMEPQPPPAAKPARPSLPSSSPALPTALPIAVPPVRAPGGPALGPAASAAVARPAAPVVRSSTQPTMSKPAAAAAAAPSAAAPRMPVPTPTMPAAAPVAAAVRPSIPASLPTSKPAAPLSAATASRPAPVTIPVVVPPPDIVPIPRTSEWACDVCTFLNEAGQLTCVMCQAPRPQTVSVAHQEEAAVAPQRTAVPLPMSPPIPLSPPFVPRSVVPSAMASSPIPSPPSSAPSTVSPPISYHSITSPPIASPPVSFPSVASPPIPSPPIVSSPIAPSYISYPSTTSSPISSPPVISPPIPISAPLSNPRRSTQPLPSSRPTAPADKRVSVLEGMPSSELRGPAPAPAGPRFPAQFQQQAAQAAQAAEAARREAAMREAAAAQQRQAAQQMLAATAAQQLKSLTPLSSKSSPPSQQRILLDQQEQWLAAQHAQQQQQQRAAQHAEQAEKPALDALMNDFFSPRGQDKPVELLRSDNGPTASSTSASTTASAAHSQRSSISKPGHQHGASAEFYSLFDTAANGLAQDLLARKGGAPAPGRPGALTPVTEPQVSPTQSPVTPSPVPGSAESPRSARSASPAPPSAQPRLPVGKPPPPVVALAPVPVRGHDRVDSWEERARVAAAQGRQITPFDSPVGAQSGGGGGEAAFSWKRAGEVGEVEGRMVEAKMADEKKASGVKQGEREGEVGDGERGGEGEGQAKAQKLPQKPQPPPAQAKPPIPAVPPPSIPAVPAPSIPAHPPRSSTPVPPPPSPPAPSPPPPSVAPVASTPAPVFTPLLPVPKELPKKVISAEAKGAISSLAAALAASAALPATPEAVQTPAAEAARRPAAVPPPPKEPLPSMQIVGAPAPPPVITPIPKRPSPTPLVLHGASSSSSISRPSPDDTPATPVSTNRSSSTTRPRSPSSLEYKADMRERVRDEILTTEKFYVDCLNNLVRQYMEPLKKAGPKMGVEPRHVSAIFGNLTVLAQFHVIFLDTLRTNPATSAVFVQYADFLKMYTHYVAGYEKSIATINSLRGNKAFQRFMEEKRDQLKGRGIMTYLIMPVQRIPRYVLLLRELRKYTPLGHPEHESLEVALHKIEGIATFVNEQKRSAENRSKLLDIQNRLKRTESFTIFKPDRRLIKEGMIRRLKEEYVLERSREEAGAGDVDEELFFLFNDLLLWTTKEFDIVGHVALDALLCLPDQVSLRQPYTLSLGVRGKPYCPDMVFACKDQAEKDEWSRYILSAINTATDPSKQRNKAAALGSGGKAAPATAAASQTSAGSLASLDENDDPQSRGSYSVSSRGQSSVSSSNRSPTPTPAVRLPQSSATATAAAASGKEPAVVSKTTALPSLAVYEPPPSSSAASSSSSSAVHPTSVAVPPSAEVPAGDASAANGHGGAVRPLPLGLSSAALMQQILQSQGKGGSSVGAGTTAPAGGAPPPLLSTYAFQAPPPPLSSYNAHAPPPLLSGAPPPLMSGASGKGLGEEKEQRRAA